MTAPLMISASTNYHWVKSISASTTGSGALKLTMRGNSDFPYQFNEAEITIFTDDAALTERLIAAINGAANPIEAEQSAEESEAA